jgi:ATP-dependent protease ClpP protease subunit
MQFCKMEKHNIFISGDIVPFVSGENQYSIANLTKDLKAISVKEGDELVVDINTYGGDTESGFAMYNQLLRFKNENKISLTTRVTGYCASIGTVLLLAGDKRIGNKFNTPFVHNAWTNVKGNSKDAYKLAEDLSKTDDKIANLYAEKTSIDFETAKNLMNNSDFIDAEKILEYGFYTEIENQNILNSINYKTNDKMNFKDQIREIFNEFFPKETIKNKIVYTSTNIEVDFYELAEGEPIQVGSKARAGGEPVTGEHIIEDVTYIFENGEVAQIVEDAPEESEEVMNLKAENEALKAEIETFKNTIENQKTEIQNYIAFKNKVMNFVPEAPVVEPAEPKPAPNKTQVRTFNFK